MPFIGNQPALSYTSFAKQDFTTSATTSYTLDNPVTNANELALFINFVRQEPTTAYTASGTSLTLTSATSASDDMYCVYLGKAVQTVNPPNGSVGISQLTATGTKDATTFLRGDNTFAVAGGTNTPAFSVYLSSNQTIPVTTETTIAFDTEHLDTDSCFDTGTYRFTPTVAGYYNFTLSARGSGVSHTLALMIKLNGSTTYYLYDTVENSTYTRQGSRIIYLNGTSDYVEAKIYKSTSTYDLLSGSTSATFFTGYKILT